MKKFLLFTLFLLLPVVAMSQEYLTIGNTSSTISVNQAPINRWYNHSSAAQLYTAEEMEDGKMLTHIAFDKVSGNTTMTIEDVEIYMRHNTSSTISATYTWDLDDYQLVWEGDWDNTDASGWIEVELDEPFDYNGEDNLQILVLKYYQQYEWDYPMWRSTSTTPNNRCVYTQVDGATMPSSCNINLINRPNVRFQYVPADPDLAVVGITGPTAPYRYGTYPFSATVGNVGKAGIKSFKFHWSFNGVHQGSTQYYVNMASEDEMDIFLADLDLTYPANGPFEPFVVKAWITNVNDLPDGESDIDPGNDSRTLSTSPILHDAGITAVLEPTGSFGTGPQPVKVEITNYAPRPLNSVTIRWSMDGVQQTDYLWAGNLAYGQSTQFYIGNAEIYIKSPLAPFNFTISTHNPNGVADQWSDNDAMDYSAAPSLVPGTYTVGGETANFASPETLSDYLNASGIVGNGDVTFLINSGTYNGQIHFEDFPRGNQNTFTFRSATGNAADVKLQYSPSSANANYILRIDGLDNLSFSNLTFITNNANGFSGGIALNDLNNAVLNNIVFQGPMNPAGSPMNHYFVNGHNVNGLKVTNTSFLGGAIGVRNHVAVNVTNPVFHFANNKVNDWSYASVMYMVDGMTYGTYDIHIMNNEFRAGTSYNPMHGIRTINGSMVHDNLFNGLNNRTTSEGFAIWVQSNTGAMSHIYNNSISNTRSLTGIGVYGGYANIHDNTFNLDADGMTTVAPSAISINNTAGGVNKIYKNNITARSTVGLSANGGNLEFYQNRVHSSSNQAIVTAINTGGFIAGNQLTGVGNSDGMQVINPNGLHILYNAIHTTSSNSALHLNGNGVANIQRNIFQNGGTGYSIYAQSVNRDLLTLNENLYYNTYEPFAQWDASILDDFIGWKAISLKDQKSANLNPEFLSPSELRLTRYNASIALNEPINMDLTSAQREMYEGVDYFGKPRGENSTWYMGIDQIKPQIFVETHPASVAACIGEKEHYLLVSSIVSLSAEPNYQWYFDGVEITGEIHPILYLDNLGLGNGTEFFLNGVYSVRIGAEGGADPVWANEAAVYVIGETEIIRQPKHVAAQQGEKVVLSVGAHARFLPPNYQFDYQWFRYDIANDRVTALANNDIYAGVHTDILSVNVANDDIYAEGNSYYFVEVYGQCGMARSANVHIVKEANYGLVLTAQPQSADVCENELVILQVDAEPIDMTTSLSYQWYKDGSMVEDGEGYMGATTAALVLTDIKTTAQGVYFVIVTDDQGGNTERSKDAYVTVSTAPELISPIQNRTINENTLLIYTVQVTGQNLTFTWYHNDEFILETDTDEFKKLNMKPEDAGVYRCVISNECGEVETSATVTVTSGGSVSVLDAIEFNEVSPNPASTELNVRYSANQVGSVELKVRDLSGREVMGLNQSAQLGMNNVRLDVSNLSNGVYIIELSMGTFTQTNKIVISK